MPALRLGDLVGSRFGSDPYALIMDIEGAELDILANDAAALGTCQVMIVEVHPCFYERIGKRGDAFETLAATSGMRTIARYDSTIVYARDPVAAPGD